MYRTPTAKAGQVLLFLFWILCPLCPAFMAGSVWAGQLTIVTASGLATPELTLEGLRQKYQSPYVVSENRVDNSGKFSVYLPGFADNATLNPSKGYMVYTTFPASVSGQLTTPTVTIHPGFNLIAPPSGITSAQQAIAELGLAMLAKTNGSGKFEAVIESTTDNFSIEPGRGYIAIPKARSKGTGIVFTEEDEFHVWHLKTMSETASDQWSTPTTFGPFSSGDFDPAYTADGAKLVFASSRGCPLTIGLFQVNANGSNIQRLTGTTPSGDCQSSEFRTPHMANYIAKVISAGKSTFPGSNLNIGFYPSPRGPSFTDPIFITSDLNEQSPVFSPDGQTIYFLADWDGVLKLYRVPAWIPLPEFANQNRFDLATKLSDRPVTADGLSVSPDGSVVFTSNGDIWRRSWDGVETNLTNSPGVNEKEASYSPDGSRICYVRANTDGVYTQVRTMRADGSGQSLIHDSGREVSLNHAWKP